MESLIIDIRALKSGMLSVKNIKLLPLKQFKKKFKSNIIASYLTELFINNSNFKFLSSVCAKKRPF